MRTITISMAALAAAACLASPAFAQQTPTGPRPAATATADEGASTATPRHAAAQATGYRALHLCTAPF
ncbi:MAG: hypothetical protein B7Z22_04040, partial [Hyphomonas sp. 32-62-5]